jgi:uncharacterized membrane protein YhdT
MQVQERRQARWAPWWLYVIALVVTNQVRTLALQPDDLPFWLEVVLGAGSMALVAALVTVVYRAVRR